MHLVPRSTSKEYGIEFYLAFNRRAGWRVQHAHGWSPETVTSTSRDLRDTLIVVSMWRLDI